LKLAHAQQIAAHLAAQGIQAEAWEDYAGRMMYGRTTAGVVTKSLGDVVHAMGQLGITERIETDSMGLDMIVY